MKKGVTIAVLVVLIFGGHAQNLIAKITFETIRMKGINGCADVITKEFYNTLKMYGVYKFYPNGIFLANDLSDTTNQLIGVNDTLEIIDGHVYHIYAPLTYEKVSIIMIAQQESLFFFKGLNCCKPKHNLSDVLYWMHSQPNFDDTVFSRVDNYYLYYSGISVDISGAFCECSEQIGRSGKRYKKPDQIKLRNFKKTIW
jgi:hypothetical protein